MPPVLKSLEPARPTIMNAAYPQEVACWTDDAAETQFEYAQGVIGKMKAQPTYFSSIEDRGGKQRPMPPPLNICCRQEVFNGTQHPTYFSSIENRGGKQRPMPPQLNI